MRYPGGFLSSLGLSFILAQRLVLKNYSPFRCIFDLRNRDRNFCPISQTRVGRINYFQSRTYKWDAVVCYISVGNHCVSEEQMDGQIPMEIHDRSWHAFIVEWQSRPINAHICNTFLSRVNKCKNTSLPDFCSRLTGRETVPFIIVLALRGELTWQ